MHNQTLLAVLILSGSCRATAATRSRGHESLARSTKTDSDSHSEMEKSSRKRNRIAYDSLAVSGTSIASIIIEVQVFNCCTRI